MEGDGGSLTPPPKNQTSTKGSIAAPTDLRESRRTVRGAERRFERLSLRERTSAVRTRVRVGHVRSRLCVISRRVTAEP